MQKIRSIPSLSFLHFASSQEVTISNPWPRSSSKIHLFSFFTFWGLSVIFQHIHMICNPALIYQYNLSDFSFQFKSVYSLSRLFSTASQQPQRDPALGFRIPHGHKGPELQHSQARQDASLERVFMEMRDKSRGECKLHERETCVAKQGLEARVESLLRLKKLFTALSSGKEWSWDQNYATECALLTQRVHANASRRQRMGRFTGSPKAKLPICLWKHKDELHYIYNHLLLPRIWIIFLIRIFKNLIPVFSPKVEENTDLKKNFWYLQYFEGILGFSFWNSSP